MPDVFISYVEEDRALVLALSDGLEAAGFTTWCYERHSVPGPSYLIQTGQAIEACHVFLIVLSSASRGSWQIDREVVRAFETGKHFIPVLHGVEHAEFQARRPEWRQAIGGATSIPIPAEGVQGILPRIVRGLKMLRIEPAPAEPTKAQEIFQAGPSKETRPGDSLRPPIPWWQRRRNVGLLAAAVLVLAFLAIFVQRQGGRGSQTQIAPPPPAARVPDEPPASRLEPATPLSAAKADPAPVAPRSGAPAKPSELTGTLEVLTTPQAEVLLGGKSVGRADARGRLEVGSVRAGAVRLEIRRPGYRPEDRTVTISADEFTTVSASLTEIAIPTAPAQPAPDFAPHRSLVGHTTTVYAVAFSPDSRWLISGDHNGGMRLWEISSGRQLRSWDLGSYPINRIAISPDGRLLGAAPGGADAVHIGDLPDGGGFRTLKPIWGNLYDSTFPCFAFSSDSRRIAIASREHLDYVWVADVLSGRKLLQLDSCCGILAMPGGGWLVLPFGGKREHGIRVFDGAGKVLRSIPLREGAEYQAAALTTDGRWLAGVDWSNRNHIQLWDVATGREGYELHGETEKEDFHRLAFSPDGRWLASRSGMRRPSHMPLDPAGSRLKIWDMSSGQVARRFTPEGHAISLAYSPDGDWLALGMDEGAIKLWRRKP